MLREIAEGVAVFCNPTNPGAFAGAIGQVLDAPSDADRRRLGIERARSFTWERAALETVATYEAALGDQPLVSATGQTSG